MNIIKAFVVFLTFVVSSHGLYWPCLNLSGTWRNQLGSNMTIETIGDSNRITGQYNTSVESSRGAATISSKISGVVQNVGNGSLIAFNVLWNRGASITAWVGQCEVCDGEAKLFTTWVLRSLQTPRKRWMSTRINQDTFWRVDDIAQSEQQSTGESTANSDLLGKWSSVTGDSFDISQALEFGGFEGLHTHGSESDGALFGRFDGNQTYSAFGFAAAHPTQVKGWTDISTIPKNLTKSWKHRGFRMRFLATVMILGNLCNMEWTTTKRVRPKRNKKLLKVIAYNAYLSGHYAFLSAS